MGDEVKTFNYREFAESLKGVFRSVQPLIVLFTASIIEDLLQEAIILKMRPGLSKTIKDDLFQGYGPLASFSAKIDVAFAFHIIEANMRTDLKIIKEVRNECAHPNDFHHFDDETITKICRKFSEFKKGGDNFALFKQKICECVSAITKNDAITAALMEAIESLPTWPPDSLHEKS